MATRKMLTKAVIEAIPTPTTGRAVLYDASPRNPGLCVRKTPTGHVSFCWYGRKDGRPQRITLGDWPAMTIDQAREAARATMLGKIDPLAEKKAAREALTFGDVFDRYIDQHARPFKRTWAEDQQRYDLYLKRELHTCAIRDIARADIVALHQRIASKRTRKSAAGQKKRPGAANRALALLSKVFSFAENVLGCIDHNPARGVQRFREQSRERFLDAAELQRLLAALDNPQTPQIWNDFFKLALLTGARRGNLLAMEWPLVNIDKGIWSIPATSAKAGYALQVVLPPAALDILRRRLAERKSPTCPFVFPARHGKSGHLTEPKKAWADILERAGLSDVRIHDLRRTMGSWQAAQGASLSVIGKSLGHRNVSTTAIYARLDLDPVRESVNKAAEAMLATAKAKPATKAVG